MQGDEAIGAIVLRRLEVRPFSERQIAILQTFADQAVIAITNARMFEAGKRRTDELTDALEQQTATAEVLQIISRSKFDLAPVLNAIAEYANRLCKADGAAIWRPAGDRLIAAASFGISPVFMSRLKTIQIRPEGGSIVAEALRSRSVLHTADILADPRYADLKTEVFGGYRSHLAVPIVSEDRPLGGTGDRPIERKALHRA